MDLRNSISSSVPKNNELMKSQLAWLDDESMKKEVKKLSSELQSRSVVYDDVTFVLYYEVLMVSNLCD